ncbi:hypothetical protein CC80DRAFT_251394 [Byssothecium circinans]|uniref:VWFA domain-containing protein n=1 Tax=Byssothecium circinans TaxID=147558 RepID=A0A6A5TE87_9PLEO|nr:hypothetical protein CC80DRAFT_251394 [Byssothecium circinans]
MRFLLPFTSLSLFAILSAANPYSHPITRRGLEKCKNLQANSNNGGRKMAIVIDESGSMSTSDPYKLRIAAGKAVNDWLKGGKSADLVSVIGFDDSPRILYPLGAPAGASKAFDQITILGGTYIAGGVNSGISEVTKGGHEPTKDRSGIVVLTDGSDSTPAKLVTAINDAGSKGIRVSFGFLTTSRYQYQSADVLSAIINTGGMYATINGALAQNAFVNSMIVHGLTHNDNPSSSNASTVYNGLSVAFVLGQDGTSTLTYAAEAGEILTFAIASVGAGQLNVTAQDASGKELNKTSVDASTTTKPKEFRITTSSNGNLQLKFQGKAQQRNALFIVGTNSSIPLVNCTLGNAHDEGLTTGAKAGIGVGVPLALGLLGAGAYFAWKYFKGMHPSNPDGGAPSGSDQQVMDYKQPYVQTQSVPPSPWPTNTHPGWAMPPMKPPQTSPNNVDHGKPDTTNPDNGQPQYWNNNAPHQPNSGQPFDSNMPYSGDGQLQQPQQFNTGEIYHHNSGGADHLNPNMGDSHPASDPQMNPNTNSGGLDNCNPNSGSPDTVNTNTGTPDHMNHDSGTPDYVNNNTGGPDHTNPSMGDTQHTHDPQSHNNSEGNGEVRPDVPQQKRVRFPVIPLKLFRRKKKEEKEEEEKQAAQQQQQQHNLASTHQSMNSPQQHGQHHTQAQSNTSYAPAGPNVNNGAVHAAPHSYPPHTTEYNHPQQPYQISPRR